MDTKKYLFIIVLASPFSMMLMQEIGYFDVLTVMGGLIIANTRRISWQLLGAAIIASGNTPQALIATFIFCLITTLVADPTRTRQLLNFSPFLLVLVIWLLERMWLQGIGRTEEFGPGMWNYSFRGFLIASPVYLYSLLGPLVMLIPKIHNRIGHSIKSKEIQIVLILILVPGIFGIITTESTRDAICIMAPSLIWFLRREVIVFGLKLTNWEMIALCTLPCFLIWREGAIVEPWGILHRLFF